MIGAAAVAGQTDLQAILTTTVEIAMDLTGAPHGALGVIGAHGGLVDFVHAGFDPDMAETIGGPPQGRGLLGVISREGRTFRLGHVTDHPESSGVPPHHPTMEAFLGVPVRAGPALFGNLYLTDKEGGFTEEDEALVEALAMIADIRASSSANDVRISTPTSGQRSTISRQASTPDPSGSLTSMTTTSGAS